MNIKNIIAGARFYVLYNLLRNHFPINNDFQMDTDMDEGYADIYVDIYSSKDTYTTYMIRITVEKTEHTIDLKYEVFRGFINDKGYKDFVACSSHTVSVGHNDLNVDEKLHHIALDGARFVLEDLKKLSKSNGYQPLMPKGLWTYLATQWRIFLIGAKWFLLGI